MIKSLTGFGSVEVSDKSTQLTVLVRSVNSRFLDIKFRGIDLNHNWNWKFGRKSKNHFVEMSVSKYFIRMVQKLIDQ